MAERAGLCAAKGGGEVARESRLRGSCGCLTTQAVWNSRKFILRVLEARSQNQGVSRTCCPSPCPPPPPLHDRDSGKNLASSRFQGSRSALTSSAYGSTTLVSAAVFPEAPPVSLSRYPFPLVRTLGVRVRAQSYPV